MKTKQELVSIFEDTVRESKKFFSSPSVFHLGIPENQIEIPSRWRFSTKIYVSSVDILEKAREWIQDFRVPGYLVGILNPASHKRPGGGVETGSRACEEDICRRTNLWSSLKALPEGTYPLPPLGCIDTKDVKVWKAPETYEPLPHHFSIGRVFTMAAISHPKLVGPQTPSLEPRLAPEEESLTLDKIRVLLGTARDSGVSHLILGAWGCGAFCNPPSHMAELFQKVLEEEQYRGFFVEVCFAILDDGNTGREHNPRGNYKPFLEVFGPEEK